jgi:formylglycine-generating enzyme required for sulfatase activity
MVYLPGGTFRMGDIQGKGFDWERPVREVTLDAFAIGRYPVTVGEFRRFVEATGYQTEAEREGGAYVFDGKEWGQKSDANWLNPYFPQEDNHPVVCISWNDATMYCEWLSEQTAEEYSLPSEAEWEYACRASSETAYCFGNDERLLENYAWYSKNAEGKTHPVGQKRANTWGLYDMHGNVWEWVRDWYAAYSGEPQRDPSGPETGSDRVFRGGSWYGDADYCRSAYRHCWLPDYRRYDLGFRLARRV